MLTAPVSETDNVINTGFDATAIIGDKIKFLPHKRTKTYWQNKVLSVCFSFKPNASDNLRVA